MLLQMGQFTPHPHHSAFGSAAALGLIVLVLGAQFYGWPRTGSSNSIVSKRDWPIFSNFKEVP